MVFGLLKRNSTEIRRVPLDMATRNILYSDAQEISVKKRDLNPGIREILNSHGMLNFDFTQSEAYIIEMLESPFFVTYLDLLVGKDWTFLGKNWFTPGHAANSEFAYRQGDTVTLGYFNETCSITDDRKVKVATERDIFRFGLPSQYDPERLFLDAPKGFTESMSRGDASFSTLGTRDSAYCGRILAGKKL